MDTEMHQNQMSLFFFFKFWDQQGSHRKYTNKVWLFHQSQGVAHKAVVCCPQILPGDTQFAGQWWLL